MSLSQLIRRANITKLSELLENILDMDRRIKAHLNTLFQSKTGNFIRGEEYSKSFDEAVITRLDEAKKRVNSELKYLNEKLDQCKDMFRSVLLLKKQIKKKTYMKGCLVVQVDHYKSLKCLLCKGLVC